MTGHNNDCGSISPSTNFPPWKDQEGFERYFREENAKFSDFTTQQMIDYDMDVRRRAYTAIENVEEELSSSTNSCKTEDSDPFADWEIISSDEEVSRPVCKYSTPDPSAGKDTLIRYVPPPHYQPKEYTFTEFMDAVKAAAFGEWEFKEDPSPLDEPASTEREKATAFREAKKSKREAKKAKKSKKAKKDPSPHDEYDEYASTEQEEAAAFREAKKAKKDPSPLDESTSKKAKKDPSPYEESQEASAFREGKKAKKAKRETKKAKKDPSPHDEYDEYASTEREEAKKAKREAKKAKKDPSTHK